jgi:hypothetical protein
MGTEPKCRACRRPVQPMTLAKRERFQRWWIEESGLDVAELQEIACGLVLPA